MKSNEVPDGSRLGKGRSITNLLNLREEHITNIEAVKNFEKDYLIFATKLGIVKRLPLKDLAKPRITGVRVINLPPDGSDNLINVVRISEDQEVLLITKKGKAIRFSSKEVRSMGRASYGVKGIDLSKNDEIVSIEGVPLDKKISVLTVTTKGYGKRSSLNDYRKTSRGGKGVINLKISDKTGKVVKSMSVINSDSIILTTTKGMILRTSMKDLRIMGRATQGVKIVKLKEKDKVADALRVPREEEIKEKLK